MIHYYYWLWWLCNQGHWRTCCLLRNTRNCNDTKPKERNALTLTNMIRLYAHACLHTSECVTCLFICESIKASPFGMVSETSCNRSSKCAGTYLPMHANLQVPIYPRMQICRYLLTHACKQACRCLLPNDRDSLSLEQFGGLLRPRDSIVSPVQMFYTMGSIR